MSALGRAETRSALLGFGVVVALGFDDGGYFARSWGWAGGALAAVAALALLLRERIAVSRLELAAIGAVLAFAVWTAVSGSWGVAGTDSLREAERALLYVVALVAFMLVVEPGAVRALLVGLLAGVLALSAYGLGDVAFRSGPPDPYEGHLLYQPIGYANAHGILAAIGVLLALGLFAREPSRWTRAGAGAASAFLGVALALTESRGAWLALAVGIAVMAALPLERRKLLAALTLGALLVGVITFVAVDSSVGLGNRPSYWRVSLDDAGDHPWLGSGAGSYDEVWIVRRTIDAEVRDAHSLYLETLAELGPLGLALVVAALALPLLAALRIREQPIAALAVGPYSAFLVHAGMDWDWEVPAVTLAGLVCGCALLVAGREARAGRNAD